MNLGTNGKSALTAEITSIDAATAGSWLSLNYTGQRKLKSANVRKIARSIGRGYFQFNGQPILFDPNGRLLDGQNRLAALIEARKIHKHLSSCPKTISCLVVRGIPTEAFPTLDQGAKRTTADFMREKNATKLVAASPPGV